MKEENPYQKIRRHPQGCKEEIPYRTSYKDGGDLSGRHNESLYGAQSLLCSNYSPKMPQGRTEIAREGNSNDNKCKIISTILVQQWDMTVFKQFTNKKESE